MITWLETVAPQTTRSVSQNHAFVADFAYFPRTGGGTTTEFANWSRTEALDSQTDVVDYGGGLSTYTTVFKTYSVLGTTNSSSQIVSTSNIVSGEWSYTVKSLLEITTTETTRPYTFSQVGQTSTQTTVYTTGTTVYATASDITKTVTSETSQAKTTLFTTATQSAASSYVTTTTFAGSIIDTPIHATALQAEANEVIWVAQTSAATNCTGVSAARLLAQSTTKTTIMPWTQTIEAISAHPTNTYTIVNSLESGSMVYEIAGWNYTVSTTVAFFDALPHQTEEVEYRTPVSIIPSTVNYTVASAQTLTICGSHEIATFITSVISTIVGFTAGSSYKESAATTMTFTRNRPLDTVSQYTTSDSTSFSLATQRNYDSFSATHQRTTIAYPIQNITVIDDTFCASHIERFNGVADQSGNIGIGYSCTVNFGNISGITASRSRGVVALLPTQVTADDGEHELTISGLGVTYRPTSATQTYALTLQTFGNPQRNFDFAPESFLFSRFDPDGLGASETGYRTTKRGVYWNGSATQSFNDIASSYTLGDPVGWLEPISGISAAVTIPYEGGGVRYGQNQIWWTASRSHFRTAALTEDAAYSAP